MSRITDELLECIKKIIPDDLKAYFANNEDRFIQDSNEFSNYIRSLIETNGFKQHDIFIQADIPDRYGYKLLSGEKHTNKRDIIIRLCLAANMNISQTNNCLVLYGMNELYPRNKKDAILISCISHHVFDINKVNEFLKRNNLPILENCGK